MSRLRHEQALMPTLHRLIAVHCRDALSLAEARDIARNGRPQTDRSSTAVLQRRHRPAKRLAKGSQHVPRNAVTMGPHHLQLALWLTT